MSLVLKADLRPGFTDMMTAKIAFDRLNPKAKAEAVRLMAIPINPSEITNKRLGFFRGSVWPDDVRNRPGFEFSGNLHFADFPFSVDSTPLPELPEPENVIVALGRYVRVLKTSADDNERAQALRFIIHFVGDIHQPLHCSARVDKKNPGGDQGGNLFFIKVPDRVKLHSFWDGGLNSFPRGGGPPDFEPPPQNQIDSAIHGSEHLDSGARRRLTRDVGAGRNNRLTELLNQSGGNLRFRLA